MKLRQEPQAGTSFVKYQGDLLTISLETEGQGSAFLRTNLGGARTLRQEVIASVEDKGHVGTDAWRDLPMAQHDGVFCITLPLCEVGIFEFKTCFVAKNGSWHWTEGDNFRVKVEPALLWADNTIYNAFVRQFGPNISGGFENNDLRGAEDYLRQHGYAVQPPSGTFDDVAQKLEHIMFRLGFRIAMFLPVHPASSAYSKMGRYGSPFAAMDFRTVDNALAKFNRKTTPLQQFLGLVDKIHARGGLAVLDMPLNHTGWASALQTSHPEWFCRNEDGTFESPGAWGVVWEDLCRLDFSKKELWQELADIVLHWCCLGIDGFRCDAGYMLPLDVWKYISAKVREEYPDTVFLLEGLGGPVETTERLLTEGGLDWAYSESFQQYGYEAESSYLRHILYSAQNTGVLVNFAQTHDNNSLAAVSPQWAWLRVASAALLAPAGAFGMVNGVEWLATEKIDVHGAASLNWGAEHNLLPLLASVNRLLRSHPAFNAGAVLECPHGILGETVALLRKGDGQSVLVLVNPDVSKPVTVSLPLASFNPGEHPYDLLSGAMMQLRIFRGWMECELPPGAVFCVSATPFKADLNHFEALRDRMLKATALEAISNLPTQNEVLLERIAASLAVSNEAFIKEYNAAGGNRNCMQWTSARDCRRQVVLAAGSIVSIEEKAPFIAELCCGGRCLERRRSIRRDDGNWFALMLNASATAEGQPFQKMQLKLRLFPEPEKDAVIREGEIWLAAEQSELNVRLRKEAAELSPLDTGLCSNVRGTYSLVHAQWALLRSKYEGLLAVNFNENCPDVRYAMLPRVRAWLRHRDFSYELGLANQVDFAVSYDNALRWRFLVRCGQGWTSNILVQWRLDKGDNAGIMSFTMEKLAGRPAWDREPFTLIVRPDVDCRSHHDVTKAYQGAEKAFPAGVHCQENGFVFCGDGVHSLRMTASAGSFTHSAEWTYNVALPIEQERGLDTGTDLFSPGFFALPLSSRPVALEASAAINEGFPQCTAVKPAFYDEMPLFGALKAGLRHFYVYRYGEKHERHGSIIAGFPWFLDWGRDTLICLRGYIAAGMLDMAKDAICQFAQFEENGTLPNMIRGKDTSDRDTSDAPLWLFVAVKDFMHAQGSNAILDMKCGRRKLKSILLQLGEALWNGAQNGVKADISSALLYSRPHFTWMDTNYPAATPREGYPVEIQALWIAAMDLLAELDEGEAWKGRAVQARASFNAMFVRKDGHGLVDCRHTQGFAPAEQAAPDDAVRPNQLLAITLGVISDKAVCDGIINACLPLMVPSAIRSLDDAPVEYHLPVSDNGRLLNDPAHPYWGHYSGDEDSRRKPAYHNGTAWCWQMPLLCEAMLMAQPQNGAQVRVWLAASAEVMGRGCIGFLPEIIDGDAPHTPKGCPAQAWSQTELLRVLLLSTQGC